MQIVIVTGLSGAGKSTALRALEDIEFTCVDNIPVPLVVQMVDHLAHEGDRDKLAIAVDARQRRNLSVWAPTLAKLRGAGHRIEVMFLDASDEVLLRRFSETRRRHPLSGDDLLDGVRRDRELMGELRQGAAIVDTSNLNSHQLKAIIQDRYGGTGKLAVTFVSFGFKHGLPLEFNLVFDVRFLPNPHFVPALRRWSGRNARVSRYVLRSAAAREFLRRTTDLLRFLVPHYIAEGKAYLTIAVGCTGGRHRSVAMAQTLADRLRPITGIRLQVRHRDIAAEG
jgi:UPF0042 nucleotide-binding protein